MDSIFSVSFAARPDQGKSQKAEEIHQELFRALIHITSRRVKNIGPEMAKYIDIIAEVRKLSLSIVEKGKRLGYYRYSELLTNPRFNQMFATLLTPDQQIHLRNLLNNPKM